MQDYLTLGSTPCGENCAQVGSDNYAAQSKIELKAYRNQLIRQFGEPQFGARLVIKGFPHDFGTYHEVAVVYEENDEEACDYAFNLEGNLPEYWDKEAIKELGELSNKE